MKPGFLLLLLTTWLFTFSANAVDNINSFVWPEDGDLIGEVQYTEVASGQTLLDIAENYGLGYTDIVTANPDLDPWIPPPGARVLLPTQYVLPQGLRQGIVINLAEYRLYHFDRENRRIHTYPVGIGRENTPTPMGAMEITARIPNPTWYPPASIREGWARDGVEVRRQIPAGPDNPLGPFAISLSRKGYLIHGTNQGFGIGTRASAGCIRMNNADIEALVMATHIGVPVRIMDEPIKVGRKDQTWFVEVHDPIGLEHDSLSHTAVVHALVQARERLASTQQVASIDWDKAELAFQLKQGIPVAVSAKLNHYQNEPE
ncbi:L,D-transpeptidase family protein [Aliidiomarina sp. Khilg15.8]